MKRPTTQWVRPGLVATVKHLRGEENLRHASLQDFREEYGSLNRPFRKDLGISVQVPFAPTPQHRFLAKVAHRYCNFRYTN